MKLCTYCQEENLDYVNCLENFLEEELVPHPDDIYLKEDDQRWCRGLICRECKEGVALKVVDGQWGQVEEFLNETDSNLHGWVLSRSIHDRWLQAVLNNVVYYLNEPPDEKENETDYGLPSTDDQVRLSKSHFSLNDLLRFGFVGTKAQQLASARSRFVEIKCLGH